VTITLQDKNYQYHVLHGVSIDGRPEGMDIFYSVRRDGVTLIDVHESQIAEALIVLNCDLAAVTITGGNKRE